MQVPISMLTGAGSSKAVAVIAILAGLALVASMSGPQRTTKPAAPPR